MNIFFDKKFMKFFFSILLIFSLFIPTYASLSSTDGASFVTKAEFDSAMADFNARLTSFEAGINSKIDSQVTSFLDRNGIWSGKEQTIKNGGVLGTTGFGCSKNIGVTQSWGGYWYVKADATWASAMGTARAPVGKLGSTKTVVIDNMNKKGLMMFGFSGAFVTGSDRYGVCIMLGNPGATAGTTVYPTHAGVSIAEQLNFYQRPVGGTAADDVLLTAFSLTQQVPVPGVLSLDNYPLSYLTFFVDKNKSLVVEVVSNVEVYGTVGGSYTDAANKWEVRHNWKGESAVVY